MPIKNPKTRKQGIHPGSVLSQPQSSPNQPTTASFANSQLFQSQHVIVPSSISSAATAAYFAPSQTQMTNYYLNPGPDNRTQSQGFNSGYGQHQPQQPQHASQQQSAGANLGWNVPPPVDYKQALESFGGYDYNLTATDSSGGNGTGNGFGYPGFVPTAATTTTTSGFNEHGHGHGHGQNPPGYPTQLQPHTHSQFQPQPQPQPNPHHGSGPGHASYTNLNLNPNTTTSIFVGTSGLVQEPTVPVLGFPTQGHHHHHHLQQQQQQHGQQQQQQQQQQWHDSHFHFTVAEKQQPQPPQMQIDAGYPSDIKQAPLYSPLTPPHSSHSSHSTPFAGEYGFGSGFGNQDQQFNPNHNLNPNPNFNISTKINPKVNPIKTKEEIQDSEDGLETETETEGEGEGDAEIDIDTDQEEMYSPISNNHRGVIGKRASTSTPTPGSTLPSPSTAASTSTSTGSGSGSGSSAGLGGTGTRKVRERDPHRRKIEARASEKRKQAFKELSQALVDRTKGLPENGIANQVLLAVDLIRDDGAEVDQLRTENRRLIVENGTLKRRVQDLEKALAAAKL